MSRRGAYHERELWLLVTASSAGATDSLRVAIWRKLRSLGALYLHQSVCVLPARPDVEREIRRLVDRVRANGGAARVLRITFEDENEQAQLVPELGYADDAIIASLVLRSVVRRAGAPTVRRHWPGTDDGLAALARLTGLR